MSDIRRDALTGDWVIVAPDRGGRPHAGRSPEPSRPHWEPTCPFCPGNERASPRELARRTLASDPWQVRVVANTFPILDAHEVIVSAPDHAAGLADLDDQEFALLLETYAARWRALMSTPGTRATVVFHNEGAGAGASLEHPHSQAVALPRLPPRWARMLDAARAADACPADRLLAEELERGERILATRGAFVAHQPFASAWPYETFLSPRPGTGGFASCPPRDLRALSSLGRDVLRAIRGVLGRAPCNLVLEAPSDELEAQGLRWRVRIVPRLERSGGFELATEARVNPVAPEDARDRLREEMP